MRRLPAGLVKRLNQEITRIPFLRLMGNRILKLKPGYAEISVRYRENLSQTYGYLHGGVIASLADTAAAFATRTLIDSKDKLVTLELKINYLSPAQSNLTGIARVVHKGRRTAVIDVEVKDKKNVLCAKALVTYVVFIKGRYP